MLFEYYAPQSSAKTFWQIHDLLLSQCSAQCQGMERLNGALLLNWEPIKSTYLVCVIENLSHAKQRTTGKEPGQI